MNPAGGAGRWAAGRVLGGGPSPEFLHLCRALGSGGPGAGLPPAPFRWERFLRLAREKGVSALLPRDPAWPEPVRRVLEEDRHRTLAENLLKLAAVERILRELDRRGVPVLLLKGADLLDRLHRDPGARRMFDADLLLRPESCPVADAVLEGLGYQVYQGTRPLRTPRVEDGINSAMYLDPRSAFRIHLHWHIANGTLADAAGAGATGSWDMDRLWRESVEAGPGNAPARVLSPAHLLVHLAAHGVKHGFGLLHVHEFTRALEAFASSDAEAAEVHAAARDFGQLPALRWMLRASRERFGGRAGAGLARHLPEPPSGLSERFLLACLRRGRESGLLGILALRGAGARLPTAPVLRPVRACRYLTHGARELLSRTP